MTVNGFDLGYVYRRGCVNMHKQHHMYKGDATAKITAYYCFGNGCNVADWIVPSVGLIAVLLFALFHFN